jgi:hypothetical protein
VISRVTVEVVTLASLRGSAMAFVVAVTAWCVGCASAPPPLVDSAFAAGAYAPARIAVLPPDVFVVLDQAGENDPVQSAALGQTVSVETVRAVEQALRARGYDVDLSARWDGIAASDGSLLVSRDELGWLANDVLQFGNARAGENPPAGAPYVAPELAAKIGWATQSDAILYMNVKGVATTSGKRAASILAGVFIVFVVAAIVAIVVLSAKGGSGGSPKGPPHVGGSSGGTSVMRAPAPASGWRPSGAAPSGLRSAASGGGAAAAMPSGRFHGAPAGGAAGAMPSGSAMAGSPRAGGAAGAMPSGSAMPGASGGGWRPSGAPASAAPASGGWRAGGGPSGGWRGGAPPPRPPGAYVYDGGPHIGLGIGVVVPLDGPVYTHDGDVQHEDEMFAGDELYVSMTLVSSSDGRVLWHARQELDLDADDPQDVARMVESFVASLPPRGGFRAPPPRK